MRETVPVTYDPRLTSDDKSFKSYCGLTKATLGLAGQQSGWAHARFCAGGRQLAI